jgi:hypothetical protein
MQQIMKKLARYGNMDLARSQDIGGCRIVLPDLDQVDEAARLIANYGTNRWEVRHQADYRPDGRPDTAYRVARHRSLRDPPRRSGARAACQTFVKRTAPNGRFGGIAKQHQWPKIPVCTGIHRHGPGRRERAGTGS